MVSVLLLSDRPEFSAVWSAACQAAGLTVHTHLGNGDFASFLEVGLGLVIDAGSAACDASVLIARTALARVKGAVPLVALPNHERWSALEDLLLGLCGGLVATHESAIPTLARALRRRCERPASARFAFVGIAPDETTVLAVLADGQVAVLEPPPGRSVEDTPITRVELTD